MASLAAPVNDARGRDPLFLPLRSTVQRCADFLGEICGPRAVGGEEFVELSERKPLRRESDDVAQDDVRTGVGNRAGLPKKPVEITWAGAPTVAPSGYEVTAMVLPG